MGKREAIFSSEQCPVCHEFVTSGPHSSTCDSIPEREIIEVHPPEKNGPGREAVEAEFFPLVSAAHEFKTPLVAMLGYTDLLRNGQLGPVNEKQRQVLGEIQESAERLQKLIQNLLLLCELRAGSGSGKNRLHLEPADVNAHITELFNYWAPSAKNRSIRYELRSAPGNPRVLVDPLKLQHIVSNLIENALKFTPEHGQVTVTITPCFWERRKAQSHFLFNMERKKNVRIENAVRIDVTDTGPGVALEHQTDIFGDFVQLPGSSSRGTGLGLAIARRLVDAHHGMIWMESKPGEGSKFSVLLSQSR
jgi:signal transduction histidine kinase